MAASPHSPEMVTPPPMSIEAERTAIGACLIDNSCCDILLALTRKEMFYLPAHQEIYAAIEILHREQAPVDYLTVAEWFAQRAELEALGGAAYLAGFEQNVLSNQCHEHMCDRVAEVWREREGVRIGAEMANGALTPLEARRALEALEAQSVREGGMVAVADTIHEVGERIDAVLSSDLDDALETGYRILDAISTGHRGGDLIVISGLTSGGKTALAMNLVARYCSRGIPGAVFSIEMSRRALETRLISLKTDIAVRKINSPKRWTEAELPHLAKAIARAEAMIAGWPLWINDSGSLTDMEFIADARQMKREHDIQWIIIDYLQKMVMAGARRGVNRQEVVAHFAATASRMAKELDVPVYGLAQLTDDGKLRESRAIGQDCQFHWQPEIEKPEKTKPLNDPLIWWPATIHQYKGRDAGTGDAKMRFYPATMRFEAEDG